MTQEEFEREYLCNARQNKRILYVVLNSKRRKEILAHFVGEQQYDIFIRGDRITFLTAGELYRIRGCEFDEVVVEEEIKLSEEDQWEIKKRIRSKKMNCPKCKGKLVRRDLDMRMECENCGEIYNLDEYLEMYATEVQ